MGSYFHKEQRAEEDQQLAEDGHGERVRNRADGVEPYSIVTDAGDLDKHGTHTNRGTPGGWEGRRGCVG